MEWKYDPMEWKYDPMEEKYDPMMKVRSNGMEVRSNGMQVTIRLHFCPECPSIVIAMFKRSIKSKTLK